MQSTRRGSPEADLLTAKRDRTQTRIRQDRDPRGNRSGQAQVVRRREAIDDDPRLVTARDSVDDSGLVRYRRLPCEGVVARKALQAPINSADGLLRGEALQSLVDGRPWTQIEKVDRRPHASRLRVQPVQDAALQVER